MECNGFDAARAQQLGHALHDQAMPPGSNMDAQAVGYRPDGPPSTSIPISTPHPFSHHDQHLNFTESVAPGNTPNANNIAAPPIFEQRAILNHTTLPFVPTISAQQTLPFINHFNFVNPFTPNYPARSNVYPLPSSGPESASQSAGNLSAPARQDATMPTTRAAAALPPVEDSPASARPLTSMASEPALPRLDAAPAMPDCDMASSILDGSVGDNVDVAAPLHLTAVSDVPVSRPAVVSGIADSVKGRRRTIAFASPDAARANSSSSPRAALHTPAQTLATTRTKRSYSTGDPDLQPAASGPASRSLGSDPNVAGGQPTETHRDKRRRIRDAAINPLSAAEEPLEHLQVGSSKPRHPSGQIDCRGRPIYQMSLDDIAKYAQPGEDLDWTKVHDLAKRRILQAKIAGRKAEDKAAEKVAAASARKAEEKAAEQVAAASAPSLVKVGDLDSIGHPISQMHLDDIAKYTQPGEDLDWTKISDRKKRKILQNKISNRKHSDKVSRQKSRSTKACTNRPDTELIPPVATSPSLAGNGQNQVPSDEPVDVPTSSRADEGRARLAPGERVAISKLGSQEDVRADMMKHLKHGEELKDLDWTVVEDQKKRRGLQIQLATRRKSAKAAAARAKKAIPAKANNRVVDGLSSTPQQIGGAPERAETEDAAGGQVGAKPASRRPAAIESNLPNILENLASIRPSAPLSVIAQSAQADTNVHEDVTTETRGYADGRVDATRPARPLPVVPPALQTNELPNLPPAERAPMIRANDAEYEKTHQLQMQHLEIQQRKIELQLELRAAKHGHVSDRHLIGAAAEAKEPDEPRPIRDGGFDRASANRAIELTKRPEEPHPIHNGAFDRALANKVVEAPEEPEASRPIHDGAFDRAFAHKVVEVLTVSSGSTIRDHGQKSAKRILQLLRMAEIPEVGQDILYLTAAEAAQLVEPGTFFDSPIVTEGQQTLALNTLDEYLDEHDDHTLKVHVQDPSVKLSSKQPSVRPVSMRLVKERFAQGVTDEPWNLLELAMHVEDGTRPTFLNNTECRLLTKVKFPNASHVASRHGYTKGWKEVEKWALVAQAGALTEPHQDSHGYSTYITINQGLFGFGWLSHPTADVRAAWGASPHNYVGGRWRYVVLKRGQTVFFPAGTVHFVFRLPAAGHTLAYGGHVLRCSQIVRWVKCLLEERRNKDITNEDLSVSAPAYLDRVEQFVRQAKESGKEDKWGGVGAIDEFLRLKGEFNAKSRNAT